VAQPGSASVLGTEGRRFKSCLPYHYSGDLHGTQSEGGVAFPRESPFRLGVTLRTTECPCAEGYFDP
jgi:hypothetical protein